MELHAAGTRNPSTTLTAPLPGSGSSKKTGGTGHSGRSSGSGNKKKSSTPIPAPGAHGLGAFHAHAPIGSYGKGPLIVDSPPHINFTDPNTVGYGAIKSDNTGFVRAPLNFGNGTAAISAGPEPNTQVEDTYASIAQIRSGYILSKLVSLLDLSSFNGDADPSQFMDITNDEMEEILGDLYDMMGKVNPVAPLRPPADSEYNEMRSLYNYLQSWWALNHGGRRYPSH